MISIIIPFYNSEKYLIDCIESVFNQTHKDYELILVDDGSTDSSFNIIKKYELFQNVRIFHKKNGGLSSARNLGLDNAKGEYICFLDSDDILHPYFLEKLYNEMILNNADLVGCNFKRFCDNDILNYSFDEDYKTYEYDKINRYLSPDDGFYTPKIISCAKIFKRNLFDSLRFKLGKYHEDEFIIHRITAKCSKIIFLDAKLYFYRFNSAGIMGGTQTDKKYFDACCAYLDRISFLRKLSVPYSDSSIVFSIKQINNFSDSSRYEKKISLKYLYLISKINALYFAKGFISDKHFNLKNLILIFFPFLSLLKAGLNNICIKIKKSRLKYRILYRLYFFWMTRIYKCNIAYVGSITHGNLGDQAIAHASILFLKKAKLKPIDIPSDRINKKIVNFLQVSKMPIVLRGGGNIGNDWIKEEIFHRTIISTFLNSKILFFPETIHFSDDIDGKNELKNSIEIYSRHNELTIACRELNSYRFSKVFFKSNKTILCPDIVFTLPCKYKKNNKGNNKKVCFIMRNDKEKLDTNENRFEEIKRFFVSKNYSIEYLTTVLVNRKITMFERKRQLNKFLKKLASYDYVVTDRLHAMIFSFICDVPCVALDNSTRKIAGSYEWVKKFNKTLLFKDIKGLDNFTNEHNEQKNSSELKKSFSELKECSISLTVSKSIAKRN